MPAAISFQEFYNNRLTGLLEPIEQKRKTIVRYGIAGFSIMGLSFILFLFATEDKTPAGVIAALVSFILATILLIIFFNKQKTYRADFKQQIIKAIIEFIDPSLIYNPTGFINRADYDNSGLYLQSPDRYRGDDYVEGKRDKTSFCFSELHTEKKVSSGKNTRWVTVFKGLFFIGDFNKQFQGRTYVYSENNPQINFFSKLFSSFDDKLEKVKLESPEFEKQFIVYSTDQVEVRYILTPSFMERLVKLKEMMGPKTSVSFVNTNVNVAVAIRDSLFEPGVFSANDFNKLGDYYNTVHIVFDIIDELNLNLRIWTKE